MKRNGKVALAKGSVLIIAFIFWTILVLHVDVQPVGQQGTSVGFATFNGWFHEMTDVHMMIYMLTDWLGLVPIAVCLVFAGIGMVQLWKRKNLLTVDMDILWLGGYYVLVLFGYLFFEMYPINYRPVLIEGYLEASYPSSTTLLVLSVMPTLIFQTGRRVKREIVKKIIITSAVAFMVFVVMGRTYSGVHWFTDIVGAVLLSWGMFCLYKAVVLLSSKEKS